ncbi:MAG: glycosyltransferase [Bacteroidales bacterium]|nr:glycosyltransferase [Bacteroidales bacterium]
MRKIKILHINTSDLAGGAEEFALYLSNIKNNDLIVKTKLTNNTNVLEFKQNLVDKLFLFFDKVLWKLGLKKQFKQLLSITEEINFTYKKLSKIKEYKNADIIHLHNLHGGYFDLKSILKIAKEKKIIWTLHDMWSMTGGEAYTFDDNGFKFGRAKTPYNNIYPLNNPIIDRRKYFLEKKKEIYNKIAKRICFVAPSKYVLKEFREAYVHSQKLNSTMIYNGIDTQKFFNKNNRKWNFPRILFFYSKSPFKNPELFLDILKKISVKSEIIVFGKNLQKNLYTNNQIKITNKGFITNRDDMREMYNSCDILVFSSKQETFGLIPAEAAACGVYVLASDIPALQEQSELYPINLFSNNSSEELLIKLENACLNLHDSRNIGNIASKTIKSKLDRKKTVKKYYDLYNNFT